MAWNEPGGGNNNSKDPWGGGDQGPPDLDDALKKHYLDADQEGIENYSQRALARVWKAERFSWWMTNLLHHFPQQTRFDRKMQMAEIAFLQSNPQAQSVLAQNYVGLPYRSSHIPNDPMAFRL